MVFVVIVNYFSCFVRSPFFPDLIQVSQNERCFKKKKSTLRLLCSISLQMYLKKNRCATSDLKSCPWNACPSPEHTSQTKIAWKKRRKKRKKSSRRLTIETVAKKGGRTPWSNEVFFFHSLSFCQNFFCAHNPKLYTSSLLSIFYYTYHKFLTVI